MILQQLEGTAPRNGLINKRVLGEYSNQVDGPTLVCFCGIHGNEPSSVFAFKQVMKVLNDVQPRIKGQVIGLAGNISALKIHRRFVDHDLNRLWDPERMQALEFGTFAKDTVEGFEQKELLNEIRQIAEKRKGRLFFIDLHTTSAESQPYISINDTLRNRNLALKFPLPIVLGLEEHLEGTILSHINTLGHIALGFEAGQHDDPGSIINHEAFIWLNLINCGCLEEKDIPEIAEHQYSVLAKTIVDGKKVFEIRHRHAVDKTDDFKMKSGFVNFQPIVKGTLLAEDKTGPLLAEEKGRVFMPLYQEQGDDGYFIVRRVKWFWLKLSAALRHLRFHRFLHLLPGVGKYNSLNNTLMVNTRWARWFVVDFFHLMGFRRKQRVGEQMIFTKRVYDVREPALE